MVDLGWGRQGTRPATFRRIPHDRVAQILKKYEHVDVESLTLHHQFSTALIGT
jgi:hypothetical protein